MRQEGEECGGCFYPPPYFADPQTCAPGLECKHVDPLQKSFGKTCVRPGMMVFLHFPHINVSLYFILSTVYRKIAKYSSFQPNVLKSTFYIPNIGRMEIQENIFTSQPQILMRCLVEVTGMVKHLM